MDLAGPVRGDHDDRRLLRPHRLDLGDGHLEVRQQLEQIRLELLVGAVELVDEQHRSPASGGGLDGLEQRAGNEVVPRHDVADLGMPTCRLGEPDRHHLPGVVPLVEGVVDVEALITLQPDQLLPGDGGQDFGDLGLADTRLPLQEQRPTEL